ncbi:MAG: amidohydrolase family protein [Thermodesulfobacteriota bacterium]
METAQELKGELLGEHDVVTPAFIDPHSHIGMVRGGEPETEAEANDRQDSLLISADALDSLQMDDVCLVNEFGIRVTVEHAMGVDKPDIFRELKQRGIPVIYGPLDSFPYKVELKHESWRNVRHLVDSGVEFGLMSDHPVTPARQLLLQCRWLLRHGCSTQQAIEVISRKNAEILGLGNMLGTLEPGKWASFTCWNGDPFHLTSYPVAMFGEGTLLHTEEKTAQTTC